MFFIGKYENTTPQKKRTKCESMMRQIQTVFSGNPDVLKSIRYSTTWNTWDGKEKVFRNWTAMLPYEKDRSVHDRPAIAIFKDEEYYILYGCAYDFHRNENICLWPPIELICSVIDDPEQIKTLLYKTIRNQRKKHPRRARS